MWKDDFNCFIKYENEKCLQNSSRIYLSFIEDKNKFILLLWKGVYSYKYIDDWEKFNETPLSKKEDFYSNLKMEDIKDSDYNHAKRVFKDLEIKKLEYYDLHLKSDTLTMNKVFEKKNMFRNL